MPGHRRPADRIAAIVRAGILLIFFIDVWRPGRAYAEKPGALDTEDPVVLREQKKNDWTYTFPYLAEKRSIELIAANSDYSVKGLIRRTSRTTPAREERLLAIGHKEQTGSETTYQVRVAGCSEYFRKLRKKTKMLKRSLGASSYWSGAGRLADGDLILVDACEQADRLLKDFPSAEPQLLILRNALTAAVGSTLFWVSGYSITYGDGYTSGKMSYFSWNLKEHRFALLTDFATEEELSRRIATFEWPHPNYRSGFPDFDSVRQKFSQANTNREKIAAMVAPWCNGESCLMGFRVARVNTVKRTLDLIGIIKGSAGLAEFGPPWWLDVVPHPHMMTEIEREKDSHQLIIEGSVEKWLRF